MTQLRFTVVDRAGFRSVPFDVNIPVITPPPGKIVTLVADGSGDGTPERPWTLAQARAQATGGDVWLRGGDYSTAVTRTMNRKATAADPIVLRSYPGEWAILSSSFGAAKSLDLYGEYIKVRDVGFANTSSESRVSGTQRAVTLDVHALGGDVINCIMVDGGTGIGHWEQCGNSKVYGNVVLDNGTFGTDRAHGPGIYAQNKAPASRLLRHNLFLNALENGIKYGTQAGYVENFDVDENWVICPGAHYEFHQVVFTGGATEIYAIDHPLTNVLTRRNGFYVPADGVHVNGGGGFMSYYNGFPNDYAVEDNWIAASGKPVAHQRPVTGSISVRRNLMWTLNNAGLFVADQAGASPARLYEGNQYYASDLSTSASRWNMPHLTPPSHTTLASWQAKAGDAGATFTRGLPPDRTWVYPNEHEIGRANIVVANHNAHASSVPVDVSSVLAPGQSWWLYNAMNPYAGAIASGVYEGGGISVPMTEAVAGPARTPVGLTAQQSIFPKMGAFILRRLGPQWVGPTLELAR